MNRALVSITLLAALGLSACSTTSPDVVRRGDTQRLSQVQDAVVLNVRGVQVEGDQSGLGGTAGAVVGGIAGSSVGGRREQAAVGVLAAVAGAVIGNAIERSNTRENAVEIMLQLPSGDRRVIVQAKGEENFQAGDKVLLITTGGRTRVAKAPVGSAPVGSTPAANSPAEPAPKPQPLYAPAGRS